jgi:ADP-ribose pyrophosphatase YjhB (NUDIX family)
MPHIRKRSHPSPEIHWCRERESNPQESSDPVDFESTASASSAIPAGRQELYGPSRTAARAQPLAGGAAATTIPAMRFCPSCAAPVAQRVPEGDHLPRFVCTACGAIHYRNPKLVAGCVAEHAGRILVCRRAIEPRRGYWTVPAGFMEVGETLQQAAARECHEEALARVVIADPCAIVHVLHAEQVHVLFRARLDDASFGVGAESLETALCDERDIPWPEIAFASVEFTLRRYFEDRAAGRALLHFHTIE